MPLSPTNDDVFCLDKMVNETSSILHPNDIEMCCYFEQYCELTVDDSETINGMQ